MSIRQIIEKGKSYKANWLGYEKEIFVALLFILVAFLAFGLGRLSKIESSQQPIQIENAEIKN